MKTSHPAIPDNCPRCRFGAMRNGRCMNCDDAERFAVKVHEKFAGVRGKQPQEPEHPWREKDEEGD